METTCQDSYPLNSENASPPGTFNVYLSWAASANTTRTERHAPTNTVTRTPLRFISNLLWVTRGAFYRPFPNRLKEMKIEDGKVGPLTLSVSGRLGCRRQNNRL